MLWFMMPRWARFGWMGQGGCMMIFMLPLLLPLVLLAWTAAVWFAWFKVIPMAWRIHPALGLAWFALPWVLFGLMARSAGAQIQ